MKLRIQSSTDTVETTAKAVHALRSWVEARGARRGVLSAGSTVATLKWRVGNLAACTEAHETVRAAILDRGGEVLDLRDAAGQRLTVDQASVVMRNEMANGCLRIHYRHGPSDTNAFLEQPVEVVHD